MIFFNIFSKYGFLFFSPNSLNKKSKFHNNNLGMNKLEAKWMEIAIKNWINGKQNTPVTEKLELIKDN